MCFSHHCGVGMNFSGGTLNISFPEYGFCGALPNPDEPEPNKFFHAII